MSSSNIMSGSGLLKGMVVTAKNFFGSYVSKERLTTVSYPEEKSTVSHFSRNVPFLVFDGDDADAGMRCTSCFQCEKACPPKCIIIEKAKDENGKPLKRPAEFKIDMSVCMGCQICVEVCPFESIWMDSEFELATTDRFDGLLFDLKKLLKSNEYFHEIHPQDAEASDERLRLLAEKKKATEAKKLARQKAAAEKKAAEAKEKKEEGAE